MNEQGLGPGWDEDLRASIKAWGKLSEEPKAFAEAHDAFVKHDAERFQAILDRIGLPHDCDRICFLFCEKRCVGICHRLCPERPHTVDVTEIREFVGALAKAAVGADSLTQLAALAESENVEGWKAELERLGLVRFCHQICHFLCRERCKRVCREICLRPDITRISSIPTSQFDPQGFGQGPSVPPFQVPAPNPGAGVGDHPVGASSWLRGVFNLAGATQYKVEVAPAPAGPYVPIAVSVLGYNIPGVDVWRFPSGSPDPGWYDVADIPLSDDGPSPAGEKTLLYWPTPADGLYFLRLRARNGVIERVGGPRPVRVDNTPPPTPVITLELKTPSGQLKPLKCGKVKRGDGLIRITVQAFDPNFSLLTVAAQGNSSLSVPIVAVPEASGGPAVPLSKTYNGNTADTGYPAPTSYLWDPWNDPAIKPCCYVVRIDIWDRTVINNTWAGGHHNAGWEAIELGL